MTPPKMTSNKAKQSPSQDLSLISENLTIGTPPRWTQTTQHSPGGETVRKLPSTQPLRKRQQKEPPQNATQNKAVAWAGSWAATRLGYVTHLRASCWLPSQRG